jgi:hypothetical protein
MTDGEFQAGDARSVEHEEGRGALRRVRRHGRSRNIRGCDGSCGDWATGAWSDLMASRDDHWIGFFGIGYTQTSRAIRQIDLSHSQVRDFRNELMTVAFEPRDYLNNPLRHGFIRGTIIQAGGPCHAVEGWRINYLAAPNGAFQKVDGHSSGLLMANSFNVPVRRLWPGLLANTAFYGVILWALWSTPGAVLRGLRRRRGSCVRCGYDLRGAEAGAGCPECGDG